MADLGMPQALMNALKPVKPGLVVFSGSTGSGKSLSLSSAL